MSTKFSSAVVFTPYKSYQKYSLGDLSFNHMVKRNRDLDGKKTNSSYFCPGFTWELEKYHTTKIPHAKHSQTFGLFSIINSLIVNAGKSILSVKILFNRKVGWCETFRYVWSVFSEEQSQKFQSTHSYKT